MVHYMKLKLLDDENRDGSRNGCLLAIQPPDAAACPRKFYWIVKHDLVSRASLLLITQVVSSVWVIGSEFITVLLLIANLLRLTSTVLQILLLALEPVHRRTSQPSFNNPNVCGCCYCIIPTVNSFKSFTEFSTWFIAEKFTWDPDTTSCMTFAANDINIEYRLRCSYNVACKLIF
jgi:hypothetical protein